MNKKLTGKAALVPAARAASAPPSPVRSPKTAPTWPSATSAHPTRRKRWCANFRKRACARSLSRPTRSERRSRQPGAQGRRALRSSRHPREQRRRIHHRPRWRGERRGRAKQFAINVGGVNAAVREAAKHDDRRRSHHLHRFHGRTSSPWPGIADYSATKARGGCVHAWAGLAIWSEGHHRQRD